MKVNNKRNGYGVKDSSNTYLTVSGRHYEQWSDFKTKEECETEYPQYKFIQRKQKGFTRIYRLKGEENLWQKNVNASVDVYLYMTGDMRQPISLSIVWWQEEKSVFICVSDVWKLKKL